MMFVIKSLPISFWFLKKMEKRTLAIVTPWNSTLRPRKMYGPPNWHCWEKTAIVG